MDFTFGPKVLSLGYTFLTSTPLVLLAQSVLDRLSHDITSQATSARTYDIGEKSFNEALHFKQSSSSLGCYSM